MDPLEFHLFGTPEVLYQGRALKFPTRKALALLVYLAVTREQHSREHLTALLWPESDARRGPASLRNTLLRPRQSLGTAQTCLRVADDSLAFDPAGASLDLHQVELAVRGATSRQAAVELYRGDFLNGFTLPDTPVFDEWVIRQREYWHHQMSQVFGQLVQQQAHEGDLPGARATATRWVHHDPLHEAAHRRLMEIHLATGDRAAALQTYEICRTLFAQELGIVPSPETRALAAQIKANEQQPLATGPVEKNAAALSRPHMASPPSLPFVGRSVKHLQLVTAYHAARQGQTQVVVIEGEAGIGKTRLVTEFLKWAAAQGADWLHGRAFETGGRIPYQLLVEALRPRLERENAPEDLLPDVWLAELSRLLPELRDRYPDLQLPAHDDATARSRLLEALARLGAALVGQKGTMSRKLLHDGVTLLFIDDLQWADVATLDVLHYCGRAWNEQNLPILILLNLRQEAAADPMFSSWLMNLTRDVTLTRLTLTPITATDTHQLVQALIPASGAPEKLRLFSDFLYRETEGQPFFIAEMIRELTARQVLQFHPHPDGTWQLHLVGEGSWTGTGDPAPRLPESISQLIRERTNRLTSNAVNLLTAAAVLGHPSNFRQLCQVAHVEKQDGLSAIDQLVSTRLFLETTDPAHAYMIAHDKIRQVAYSEAGPARRQLFHERAFTTLAAMSAPAAELAFHARAAQLAEPAFRYSVLAGDQALSLFAVSDAIAHYEQAREAANLSDDEDDWTRLYLGLGRAYELAGELESAEAAYNEMHRLAETRHKPALACTALSHMATVAVHRYDFDTAEAYLQRAGQAAEASGQVFLVAETEWSRAQLAHHRFDFEGSRVYSERTLRLARELSNHDLIARSLNSLAYAQLLLGDVKAGLRGMVEAQGLFATLGNQALEADCLTAIAAAHIWLGQTQKGIEAAQSAEGICSAIDNPWGHIYSQVWLAVGLLDSGENEAALAVALAGQQQADEHHLPPMAIFIHLVLGKVYQALLQPQAAYEAHVAALRINEKAQSDSFAELIATELCTDCVMAGQWVEAIQYARQAASLRRYTSLPLIIPARWTEVAALLRGGYTELAQQDIRKWGERIKNVPRLRIPHLHSLAVLAHESGDLPKAVAHLEEAFALAEAQNLLGEQWLLLSRLAEVHPEPASAEERKRQAIEVISCLKERMEDEALKTRFALPASVEKLFG